MRSGRIRFVFQDGIGAMKRFADGSYSVPVEESEVMELLEELRAIR
ncbi:hypothetical protein JI735_04600 [Paenibacillus sonchi]|uniref:Uncharacterized protein n=1 Tax=Paenibacillus sonchi TaxID=373687 RepID=A0A974SDZ7_9BACL|nr:hypothetical protein [Paenibacillus sonchi]MCE3203293.1 hypothetical protein [Paenibacillus sonchi]QQZ61974.1 hypothetical protein JI735_04600 [Paenibacillus sonchi]